MDKLEQRIIEKFGTQREFARACKVSEASVSRMLRGMRSWRAETIWKAAEILDIPDNEIKAYFFDRVVANKATEDA